MNKIKVSRNFSLHEFECNDGSHLVKLDEELVDKLQRLRDYVNKPVIINSGYRTPSYNRKVKGSSNSQHLYGRAADIKVEGYTPKQIAEIAKKLGFTGIGLYSTFTHVDVRPNPHKRGYSYWIR